MPHTKSCRYLLLILMFFMFKNQVEAEHIYGGNLYMLQTDKDAGKFKVALNMFVDFIIMPSSEDTYLQKTPVTIRIFRKRDNLQIQEISMPFEVLQVWSMTTPPVPKSVTSKHGNIATPKKCRLFWSPMFGTP